LLLFAIQRSPAVVQVLLLLLFSYALVLTMSTPTCSLYVPTVWNDAAAEAAA
jgi:hypothetical protein